jgi:membrane protease YdiL (CAAX protease family)
MRKRLKGWQTALATLLGLGVGVGVSSVVGGFMVLAMLMQRGGSIQDLTNTALATELSMSLPVLGTTLFITAVGFSGSGILAAYFAKLPVKETLGLVPAHPATFVAAMIGILAFGPTSDALVRLAKHFLPSFGLGSLEALEQVTRAHPFLVLFPFIALMPGFGEELFFRGLIQRTFTRPAVAITVSAIAFSCVHIDPQHIFGVLPLGFFLAWTAHRTGSTWVTIVAHVTNNTAALAASQLTAADAEEGSLRETLIAMPIGWVVGAIMIYVIWRYSRPVTPQDPPEDPLVATFS